MKKLKTVLFDFDGVLSKGRFYATISEAHPEIHSRIIECVFSKDSGDIVRSWMRGEMSFEELHANFADQAGTTVEFLNKALIDSVLEMELNSELMAFNSELRNAGIQTAVFTDNMDVFDRHFVPHKGLEAKFDYIFSSSEYGKLKLDNDAEFLKHVLEKVDNDPSETLFLDDSPKIYAPMKSAEGKFYLYDDYKDGYSKFRKWFSQEYGF